MYESLSLYIYIDVNCLRALDWVDLSYCHPQSDVWVSMLNCLRTLDWVDPSCFHPQSDVGVSMLNCLRTLDWVDLSCHPQSDVRVSMLNCLRTLDWVDLSCCHPQSNVWASMLNCLKTLDWWTYILSSPVRCMSLHVKLFENPGLGGPIFCHLQSDVSLLSAGQAMQHVCNVSSTII